MARGQRAGQHQQLLDAVALDRPVEDLLDLIRRVQMCLVGRERAVLAVAATRPRERQREVSAERDAAAHSPWILRRPQRRPILARLPRVRILWLVVALLLGGCGSTQRQATARGAFHPPPG